jgi:hypothetical protein
MRCLDYGIEIQSDDMICTEKEKRRKRLGERERG